MQRDFGRTATRKRNYVDGLAEELQRSIGHAPPFTGLPFAANTLCDQGLGQKAEEMQGPRLPSSKPLFLRRFRPNFPLRCLARR